MVAATGVTSGDMTSGLYAGVVRHRRRGQVNHEFASRVVMGLFDLDELPILDREVFGFAVDRPAPVAFRARDHGFADGTDLRTWLADVTAGHDLDINGPAQVLCMPRVAGVAFDPLSVWFCHDRGGRPSAIVHEVRNTFGDRHAYVIPRPLDGPDRTPDDTTPGQKGSGRATRGHGGPLDAGGPWGDGGRVMVAHRADKVFHVSPFFDVGGDYDFTLRLPDEHAAMAVTHHAEDGDTLTASFVGRRQPFTTAALWRAMLANPLLPQRVLARIHIEAVRLWRKGATFHPRPRPGPSTSVGQVRGQPGAQDIEDRIDAEEITT